MKTNKNRWMYACLGSFVLAFVSLGGSLFYVIAADWLGSTIAAWLGIILVIAGLVAAWRDSVIDE